MYQIVWYVCITSNRKLQRRKCSALSNRNGATSGGVHLGPSTVKRCCSLLCLLHSTLRAHPSQLPNSCWLQHFLNQNQTFWWQVVCRSTAEEGGSILTLSMAPCFRAFQCFTKRLNTGGCKWNHVIWVITFVNQYLFCSNHQNTLMIKKTKEKVSKCLKIKSSV